MIRNTVFSLMALVFCTFTGLSAYAATDGSNTFPTPAKSNAQERRPHVGLLAGYSNPEGGSYTPTVGYGVDFGIQPYIPFSIGAELASTTNDGALTRTTLLARGTYNFGGSLPLISHSYFGAMLGPVLDTESHHDGVHFGIAPVLGFDIPVGSASISENTFTLGLNARYLFVNESAPDTFALNGAMKYWF